MIIAAYRPRPDTEVAVDDHPEDCAGCTHPTRVRINGTPGHYMCIGPEARTLTTHVVELPTETDVAPADPVRPAPPKIRFLDDLVYRFPPTARDEHADGKRRMLKPYWRPRQPEVMDLVRVQSSAAWVRPGWTDLADLTHLDRSGAFISSASSVDVALGELEPIGDGGYAGPGLYKATVFPWPHADELPSPLPGEPGEQVWICSPRAQLLSKLAAAGRWPEAHFTGRYIGRQSVRLDRWAAHVATVRADVLDRYGRDSAEYKAVKDGFGQAVTLMGGSRSPGQRREWPNSQVHRPDYCWSIQEQHAVTMWRWADACLAVTGRGPAAMQALDELVVERDQLEQLTATRAPGMSAPLQLDPSGKRLGTFKIKSVS